VTHFGDGQAEQRQSLRLTNKLDVSGCSGTNIDPLPLLCSRVGKNHDFKKIQKIRFFMVALCNRADHNIFMPWFVLLLLSFFSSPNLSRRRLDVCHTSTYGVALVRI